MNAPHSPWLLDAEHTVKRSVAEASRTMMVVTHDRVSFNPSLSSSCRPACLNSRNDR